MHVLKTILIRRQKYAELPEPVVFMSVEESTSGRINEEFLRLLFLDANRETSSLSGELTEESVQFLFIRSVCTCVSEEGGDGESADSEALSLL